MVITIRPPDLVPDAPSAFTPQPIIFRTACFRLFFIYASCFSLFISVSSTSTLSTSIHTSRIHYVCITAVFVHERCRRRILSSFSPTFLLRSVGVVLYCIRVPLLGPFRISMSSFRSLVRWFSGRADWPLAGPLP